jgi:O-antigen/teichoic acid export membrane protein
MSDLKKEKTKWFSNVEITTNLRKLTIKGSTVNLITQIVNILIQIVSTALLARILVPEDFGLLAMVYVVIRFAAYIKDAGLSMATVQRADIKEEEISALFWINAILSFLAMLIVCGSMPLASYFYHEKRVIPIGITLGFSLFVSGVGLQYFALLKRKLRFLELSIIDIGSTSVGIIVAIIMAFSGMSYWSLVAMNLVTPIVSSLAAFLIVRWIPKRPRLNHNTKSMISFGWNFTVSNIFSYLVRNVDNLLIGWKFDPVSLGFYSKAYTLASMPEQITSNPISQIMQSTLSRVQNNSAEFKKYFCKGLGILTFLYMPMICFIYLSAGEITSILLGNQWLKSSAIIRALCPAFFALSVNCIPGWILFTSGRSDRLLKWQLFDGPINIIAFLVGLNWGVIGIAYSFSICQIFIRFPAICYAIRNSPIKLMNILEVIWRQGISAVLAIWFVTIISPLSKLIIYFEIKSLMFNFISYSICYLVTIVALPGGLSFLKSTLNMVNEFVKSNPIMNIKKNKGINLSNLRQTVAVIKKCLKRLIGREALIGYKAWLDWRKGVNTKRRDRELIVSLTSIPKRFNTLHLVIETILSQTTKPDRIVLWLSYYDGQGKKLLDGTSQLPSMLQCQMKRGLEIKFCEDIRSYRKLLPSLRMYQNADIVTADDDTLYPKNWLKKLYSAHLKNLEDVIAYRGCLISFDAAGNLLPYKQWPKFNEPGKSSIYFLPTGCDGVLYPSGTFNESVMDSKVFMNICPTADDVWFKAMSLYNSKKCYKIFKKHKDFPRINSTQTEDQILHYVNIVMGQNDIQIKAVFELFNIISILKTSNKFSNSTIL